MSRNTQTMEKKNTRSSNDKSKQAIDRRKARFDEDNIRDTLHPEGKDYGHMKIDEPKTPFVLENDGKSAPGTSKGVDANVLQKKLQQEIRSTNEEQNKKKEFEERRKAHYDEFKTVKAIKDTDNTDEESPSNASVKKCANGANKPSSNASQPRGQSTSVTQARGQSTSVKQARGQSTSVTQARGQSTSVTQARNKGSFKDTRTYSARK